MHPKTIATLEQLRQAHWFNSVGVHDTKAAEVLSSWDEAIESCDSAEWENLCLEAANQYRERLVERAPEEFAKWNDIVLGIKPAAMALVREKTKEIIEANELPRVFIDTVNWAIVHLCMEAEHGDIYPRGFFASQSHWYVKGHIPCGWRGKLPRWKARQLLTSEEDVTRPMNRHIKNVEDLTIRDLESFPVWEFLNMDDKFGEMAVQPVKKIPTESLAGRLAGVRVRLSNGSHIWALIGNVDVNDPYFTRHFITISLFHKGKSFYLARYHDLWAPEHGPKALAVFLRLPIGEIFPISYDLSGFALGNPAALIGTILEEPDEKLSRDQIMALVMSKSTPTNYDK